MTDRAARRRAIADKLAADIARLKKEIKDRRRHLDQAKARAVVTLEDPVFHDEFTYQASWFKAWSRHAPALARAVGALARAQKKLPGAQERADRTAMIEREKRARIERIQGANVGLMKRLDALKAEAPAIHTRWEKEREQEEKRIAARIKQLNKRTHKDGGDPNVAERHTWWRRLPKLPEPIKQPDLTTSTETGPNLAPPREGLIPGTFKVMDPSRVGGIVDRPRAPKVWTAHHVGLRLIEAHKVLARLPEHVWPKQYGKAWPAYKHEFAEHVVQAGAGTLFFGRNAPVRGATADEVARMNEAIYWPMQFLAFAPGTAADVNSWAAMTTEEEFEFDSKDAPWAALQLIADALNAAKEIVR